MFRGGDILRTEQEVLSKFRKWAENNDLLRAAVLTSSRVNPDSSIDFISDYDIELYVKDLSIFELSDNWLNVFGPIMVRWPYKPGAQEERITRLVLFKDGVRIDFQITDNFEIKADTYDNGYKILIDKDGILDNLDEPTYSQYIIKKPAAEEYEKVVHEFWWDAIYVPKYLWRDELPFAKYMLDNILRYSFLHPVIDWYIGMQNNWSVNTGIHGKKYKFYLDKKTWKELESTYTGADIKENWIAFFNTLSLFRKLAKKVGENLGYNYPGTLDREVTQYCMEIKETKRTNPLNTVNID